MEMEGAETEMEGAETEMEGAEMVAEAPPAEAAAAAVMEMGHSWAQCTAGCSRRRAEAHSAAA